MKTAPFLFGTLQKTNISFGIVFILRHKPAMGLGIKQTLVICSALGISACQAQTSVTKVSTPNKIASTSLCGDTYLQAFAPDNISALSWQSHTLLSRATASQKQLPQIDASTERLLPVAKDWVLFGSGEGAQSQKYLTHALELTWVESFEGVSLNAGMILDKASLPKAHLNQWIAKLTTLQRASIVFKARQTSPRVLYLTRAGGSAGPGTFINEVIQIAGGTNINPVKGWHTPNIETLLTYDADIILTSFNGGNYHSRSDTHNPVLQNYLDGKTIIEVEGKYWPCAGPGLLDAVEILQDGIQEWGTRNDA